MARVFSIGIISLALCVVSSGLPAALPQDSPIELLWLLLSAPLTEQTRDIYSCVATDEEFAKFDAFAVLTDPPTFETYNEAFRQGVKDLSAQARRPMIYASFTVGTEGWETSNNSRFAQARGIAFHPERNMPRERWFEELRLIQMGLWGLTIEALARVPTATDALPRSKPSRARRRSFRSASLGQMLSPKPKSLCAWLKSQESIALRSICTHKCSVPQSGPSFIRA